MSVNPATANALEYIAQRASDVYRAYTPGAQALHPDVAAQGTRAQAIPDPLAIAPPAGTYLVSNDWHGRTCYTQNGNLHLANGTLTGSDGRPVLGFTNANATLSELRIDPVDFALGRAANVRIDADGSVVYSRTSIDPQTGGREEERVSIGRIALARFPAGTKLTQRDADSAVAPAGVVPHIGRPSDGNFDEVAPMHETPSGVDLDLSLQRLNDAYMALDALLAAHKAQGSLGRTAMDLLK